MIQQLLGLTVLPPTSSVGCYQCCVLNCCRSNIVNPSATCYLQKKTMLYEGIPKSQSSWKGPQLRGRAHTWPSFVPGISGFKRNVLDCRDLRIPAKGPGDLLLSRRMDDLTLCKPNYYMHSNVCCSLGEEATNAPIIGT